MPSPEQTDAAQEQLCAFLKEVHALVHHLATQHTDPLGGRMFLAETEPLMASAWKEFDSDFSLEIMLGRVRNVRSTDLIAHGLYGDQLALKLALVNAWTERYEQFGSRKILHKLIRVITPLLDSLTTAAALEGSLREFCQSLAGAMDDDGA